MYSLITGIMYSASAGVVFTVKRLKALSVKGPEVILYANYDISPCRLDCQRSTYTRYFRTGIRYYAYVDVV